jgi:hypothetical protein
MLRSLSDYLIALLELLEAEGRSAKRNAYALATAVAVFMLGTIIVAGSVGFLVAALYLGLTTVLSPAWVALICGLTLLVTGVIVLWLARSKIE